MHCPLSQLSRIKFGNSPTFCTFVVQNSEEWRKSAQRFLIPLCSLLQGQDDDFAGGIEAEGDEATYTCRDEERLGAL